MCFLELLALLAVALAFSQKPTVTYLAAAGHHCCIMEQVTPVVSQFLTQPPLAAAMVASV